MPADLRPLAVRVLDRVLGENSELPALWDDGGIDQEWHDQMNALRAVLAEAG